MSVQLNGPAEKVLIQNLNDFCSEVRHKMKCFYEGFTLSAKVAGSEKHLRFSKAKNSLARINEMLNSFYIAALTNEAPVIISWKSPLHGSFSEREQRSTKQFIMALLSFQQELTAEIKLLRSIDSEFVYLSILIQSPLETIISNYMKA